MSPKEGNLFLCVPPVTPTIYHERFFPWMLVMELEVVTFALLKNFFSFFLPFLLQDIKVHSLRRDCLWAKLCKQMYKKRGSLNIWTKKKLKLGEKMCFKAILEQEMSQSAWWQLIPQFEGSDWKSTNPSQLPLWNSSPPTKIDLSTWVTERGRMDGAGQTNI